MVDTSHGDFRTGLPADPSPQIPESQLHSLDAGISAPWRYEKHRAKKLGFGGSYFLFGLCCYPEFTVVI